MASRFRVRLITWILAAYAFCVLLFTLTPTPVDRPVASQLQRVLEELHERGLPNFIGYNKIEFAANIVMFIPIGLFIALLLPSALWWLLILIGPTFSIVLELSQKVFLPERYASIQDVAANGTGAVIGALIAVLLRTIIRHRDRLVIADVQAGRRVI